MGCSWRTADFLRKRVGRIKEEFNHFLACYGKATSAVGQCNGFNEADVLKKAQQFHKENPKFYISFSMFRHWEVLKQYPEYKVYFNCESHLKMKQDPNSRVDEYCHIFESTALECLSRFSDAVVVEFVATYMSRANEDDIRRLLSINNARGIPGVLGSIDCIHWTWKNCPMAWHGQFQGKGKTHTLVLEAIASQDTWIWHSFFGVSGKFNDLTIVQRSPVFDDLLNGTKPLVEFTVNGHQYDMPYYLTDGIYPPWTMFVSVIPNLMTHMQSKFSQIQESCLKYVEHGFGVMQARFAIIQNPALAHNKSTLREIMDCCITLDNMIVENERHTYKNYESEMECLRPDVKQDTRECIGNFKDEIHIRRATSTINTLEIHIRR